MTAILYVEDDQGVADGICMILEMHDHDVVHVTNVATAIAALDDGLTPDLLLTDIDLGPDVPDGLEGIRRIRARLPELPTIVLSGEGEIDVSGLPGPTVTVLRKPCEPAVLVSVVDRMTGVVVD